MKCSLLTLSTFIDGELAPQRRAEVDAHLVGCTRCSAGAATLREEKTRIGVLARVTVDPASTQLMLEQVGIAVDPNAELSEVVPPPPPPSLPDERRPWQSGTSSPSLPWTPRRPDPRATVGAASEEIIASPVTAEVQSDLPLDGIRSVPASWSRLESDAGSSATPVEDIPTASEPLAAADQEWSDADQELLDGSGMPESWEADLPPPAEAPRAAWVAPEPPPAVETVVPPPPAPPSGVPLHASPPTRLAAASGPAALWTRFHDAVTLRLALARGGDAIEDSVQIVSGAPTRRGAPLPVAEPEPELESPSTSGIVAAPPTLPAPAPSHPEVELHGAGAAHLPTPAADVPAAPADRRPLDRRFPTTDDVAGDRPPAEPVGSAGWNAFAASSYPEVDLPVDQPVAERPSRPLGRHSRAVAREQVSLSARIGHGFAAAAAAVGAAGGGATTRVRQSIERIRKTGPDNRLLAGIAGVGLIFVVALLVGRGSSHPAPPTATRPASTTAQPPARQSAPAQSSAAAASGAAASAPVQSFGAGDTGFQVVRLRYGAQAGYMRVVFDLGAASHGAAGTPKVTISFSTPTTMLVTFNGTVPAGSTGTPTPGKVISSVTLVSSSGNKTVYRFGLTRAATATAFYLASPTRFVLDVH